MSYPARAEGLVNSTIFEFLIWLNQGLNPSLPNHLQTLYPLDQWPEATLVEEQQWYYFTHDCKDKGFPEGSSQGVNIKSQIEFELSYLEAPIQYLRHYTMRTPYKWTDNIILCKFDI